MMKIASNLLFIFLSILIFQHHPTCAADESSENAESTEAVSTTEPKKISIVDIEGLNVNLDLKTLEQGEIGFDYDLEYTHPIIDSEEGVAGSDLDFKLLSAGYIATEQEEGQNSIISEARFSGNLSIFGLEKDKYGSFLNRRQRVIEILSELEKLDPFNAEDRAKGETLNKEMKELLNPKTFRFLTLDAHIKNEADQEFNDNQYAIGAGLTTDLAIFTGTTHIAKIVDFPFSLLRSKTNNYVTQIPRIYAGYDYVTDSDVEARKQLTSEDTYSRFTLQCAWMTSILTNIQLRITWQGYYEINAPQEIKDENLDVISFFEFSAGLPLDKNGSSMIFLKYADGELPPTDQNSSNVSLGWRIEF